MSTKMIIRHLANSTLAGQTLELDTPVITLGRRPGSTVLFDAHRDIMVSAAHARVSFIDGKWFIEDLGSSNGTFVNGTMIDRRVAIGARDRIMLGEDGPELMFTPADEMVPGHSPTVVSAPSIPPMPPPGVSVPPRRPRSRMSRGQRPLDKSHIGRGTLMGIIAGERRRALRTTILLLIFFVALSGAAAWHFRDRLFPSTTLASPTTQPTTLPTARTWSEIYALVAPSIYQVQSYRRTPNGDVFESAGTAWSVAPGLLATNAHVAAMLDDVKDDGYVIARIGGKENDLRIVSAKAHPGYAEFERLHQLYRPFLPAEGQFMNLKSPCDVALLSVHPDDVARQAPPLALADDTVLASVAAGLAIAFCGYPAEGVATNYDNPAPYQNDGAVTRLLDLFDSTATAESLVYIGHSLNTAGGASGSPIFDREGRVVAINFAGSYLFGVRIPLAGHKYAVPLRFLRELLDNTADARQAERTTLWTENIVRRYQNGLSGVRQMLIRRGNEFIDNDPKERYKGGSLVSFDEVPAGQSSFALNVPEPGSYLVLSACEDIRGVPKVTLQTSNPVVMNQITRDGRPYFGGHGEATLTVTGGAATLRIAIDGNTKTWIMLIRLKESD